jgi:PKD repeat protein/glucose/arabinose dehydrogenase
MSIQPTQSENSCAQFARFITFLGALLSRPIQCIAIILSIGAWPSLSHAVLPPGFVNEILASNFVVPTSATFDPSGRLFVAEKRGKVWINDNGVTLQPAFLDLQAEVHDAGDKGMLAVALDPDFASNGFVYVLYSVDPIYGEPNEPQESATMGRLTRYTANGNVADPGSRLVLIGQIPLQALPNCNITHAVGQLKFSQDGSLFVSCGDGAHPDFNDTGQDVTTFDPQCAELFGAEQDIGALRSQSLQSMAGKILRIDPATGLGLSDNPFYDGDPSSFTSRIWVLGLRNPFRYTIRPNTPPPGTLYIGDVGLHQYEEIDVAFGGENYGWPCREGPIPSYNGVPFCQAFDPDTAQAPLLAWHHSNPGTLGFTGSCVSGVVFYTGTDYPAQYHGKCFFMDMEGRWIRYAEVDSANQLLSVSSFADDLSQPIDLQTDPQTGNLVFISIFQGRVRQLRYTVGNSTPVAIASANPTAGHVPLNVQFSSDGTFDPNNDPTTYEWDFGDGSPHSTSPNPLHTYTEVNSFVARLIVRDATLADTAFVNITTLNVPPSIDIVNPAHGSTFTPAVPIPLTANASDPEDGSNLTYSWMVSLIHNEHIHPGWFSSSEPSPSFIPDAHGGTSDRYAYLISLEVSDTDGASTRDSVLIVPEDQVSNQAPVASLTVSDHQGPAALFVSFDASDAYDPDGDYLFYEWTFGDGSTGSGANTTHTYGAPGLYTAKLVVFDPTLAMDSTTVAILVEPGGMLAGWSFDEGEGSTAFDGSGNGRNGTLQGGASWVPGVHGSAISLDGVDDFVDTEAFVLSGRSAFTLSAWIRPDSIASHAGIVGQNDAIEFGFETPAQLTISTLNGGAVAVPYPHPTGEWHHVAATGDGSRLILYLDGSSPEPVRIGGGIFDSQDFLHGAVDDVQIFDSALPPSSIAFLANPPLTNSAPLVNAGQDLTIGVGLSFELDGSATDDGLPAPPGQVTTAWSQISGPALASIVDPNHLTTAASAPEVGNYVFRLYASDGALASDDSVNVNVTALTDISHTGHGIEEGIYGIGPMPVRSAAEIRFGVQRDGARCSLTLHDVAGRKLATLASTRWTAGVHRVTWNGRDSSGRAVSSGIYFLHLDVDGRKYTAKVPVLH